MSRVRLSLSHNSLEGSPSYWPRLLLALSSNWSMLFMDCFAFSFSGEFCFCLCQAAICCATDLSVLTPMAQTKPSSSRATAVAILQGSLPAAASFM